MIGDEETMALILSNPNIDVDVRDNYGNTAVIELLERLKERFRDHSDALIRMLSRPELDINAQNLKGNTALLIAASFIFHMNPRSDRILQTLFFHPGVDREHKNKLGQTVLTRAIVQGSRMIQTIVKGTKLSHQFRDIDNHGILL